MDIVPSCRADLDGHKKTAAASARVGSPSTIKVHEQVRAIEPMTSDLITLGGCRRPRDDHKGDGIDRGLQGPIYRLNVHNHKSAEKAPIGGGKCLTLLGDSATVM